MTSLLLMVFWAAVLVIVYTYALFPLLVWLYGRLAWRPYRQADITPSVSLIIAAYNEADTIRAKLENILALNYPRRRLQVVIASDGSDDGTNDIVQAYGDQGIRLLPLPRQGKAAALNAAVAAATGDILVFSDANSLYHPEAVRALARPFADPAVGGVAGNQCYLSDKECSLAASGEQRYWSLDTKLKRFQTRGGNATSATGAIYAIRRRLFQPIPAGVTDDFFTSTGVIAQGYRLVFAPEAIAYESVAATGAREFGRKVRIISRGLRGVLLRRTLLNPFHHGFYAVQLFSHKVLRRLVVVPLLVLLVVSLLLWSQGPLYQAVTMAQVGFYGLGLAGALLAGSRQRWARLLALPYYFCLVNTAALLAALNVLRGRRIVFWEPQRLASDTGVVSGRSDKR